ncbi:MAG TPA: NUDIX domain-containing protein [Candidatus Saccharimonadales bacterium]|nr:NUDIX domain-containing protein [Candidatus Saccharimonadales bacterium]
MSLAKSSKAKRPRVVLVNRCIPLNEEGKILLIRRSNYERTAQGYWEVPGGKLEEGQNLAGALEREVLEETGLLVDTLSPLVFVHSEEITDGPYRGLPYVVLYGTGKVVGGKLKLSEEHDRSAWVTYSEALDYQLKDDVRIALIRLQKQLTANLA